MNKWFNICVIVLFQLLCFTKCELSKEYCQQQCVSVDNCKGFSNLAVTVQQKLLIYYSCTNTQSTFFGVSSNGGKSICCPSSDVLTLLNSNEQNGLNPPLNNYNVITLKNQQPTVSNINKNLNLSRIIPSVSDQDDDVEFADGTDEGNKIHAINNRRNNIDRQKPLKRQSPPTSTLAPSPSFIGQCDISTLNQIPPAPSSGCCGRDAFDNNFKPSGVPGRPKRQSSIDHTQNWATYINQPGVPNLFSPRHKRDENAAIAASKVNITIDSRSSGGIQTEPEDYPWTALLFILFDNGTVKKRKTILRRQCDGSLISNRFILTAAHCVSKPNAKLIKINIHLAEYDKKTYPVDCKNGVDGKKCIKNIVMYSENIIRHPKYNKKHLQNDIALIKLRGTAPYTDFIRPICLTPFDIDSPKFKSFRLVVAGWGNNGNHTTNIKQATVINLVPQSECKHFYSFLTRTHLCAVGYSGEDTCKGDSGGPLMMLYKGQYFLTGIVSGKRKDFPCGTAVPSLYTNVYTYLDWIKNKTLNA